MALAMKITLYTLLLSFCTFFTSCVTGSNNCSPACEKHFEDHQTYDQGKAKAKLDIIEHGYKIYRYDMPMLKTGGWQTYYSRYKHFGIEEMGGSFGYVITLDYMRGYNSIMDTGLKQKYGTEYLKYRRNLLPVSGSTIYKY